VFDRIVATALGLVAVVLVVTVVWPMFDDDAASWSQIAFVVTGTIVATVCGFVYFSRPS
jgi:hypothetical protein